jgi:hypothetical protein
VDVPGSKSSKETSILPTTGARDYGYHQLIDDALGSDRLASRPGVARQHGPASTAGVEALKADVSG